MMPKGLDSSILKPIANPLKKASNPSNKELKFKLPQESSSHGQTDPNVPSGRITQLVPHGEINSSAIPQGQSDQNGVPKGQSNQNVVLKGLIYQNVVPKEKSNQNVVPNRQGDQSAPYETIFPSVPYGQVFQIEPYGQIFQSSPNDQNFQSEPYGQFFQNASFRPYEQIAMSVPYEQIAMSVPYEQIAMSVPYEQIAMSVPYVQNFSRASHGQLGLKKIIKKNPYTMSRAYKPIRDSKYKQAQRLDKISEENVKLSKENVIAEKPSVFFESGEKVYFFPSIKEIVEENVTSQVVTKISKENVAHTSKFLSSEISSFDSGKFSEFRKSASKSNSSKSTDFNSKNSSSSILSRSNPGTNVFPIEKSSKPEIQNENTKLNLENETRSSKSLSGDIKISKSLKNILNFSKSPSLNFSKSRISTDFNLKNSSCISHSGKYSSRLKKASKSKVLEIKEDVGCRYRISDSFLMSYSQGLIEKETLSFIKKQWLSDDWDGLFDPPEWLVPEMFAIALTDIESNSLKRLKFERAKRNLKMSRLTHSLRENRFRKSNNMELSDEINLYNNYFNVVGVCVIKLISRITRGVDRIKRKIEESGNVLSDNANLFNVDIGANLE